MNNKKLFITCFVLLIFSSIINTRFLRSDDDSKEKFNLRYDESFSDAKNSQFLDEQEIINNRKNIFLQLNEKINDHIEDIHVGDVSDVKEDKIEAITPIAPIEEDDCKKKPSFIQKKMLFDFSKFANLKTAPPTISNSLSNTVSNSKAVAADNSTTASVSNIKANTNADASGEKNAISISNIVGDSASNSDIKAIDNSKAATITTSNTDGQAKAQGTQDSMSVADVLLKTNVNSDTNANDKAKSVTINTLSNNGTSTTTSAQGSLANTNTVSSSLGEIQNNAKNNSTSLAGTNVEAKASGVTDAINGSISQVKAETKSEGITNSKAVDNSKTIAVTDSKGDTISSGNSTNGGNTVSVGQGISEIKTDAIATNSSIAHTVNAGNSTSISNSVSIGTNAPYVAPEIPLSANATNTTTPEVSIPVATPVTVVLPTLSSIPVNVENPVLPGNVGDFIKINQSKETIPIITLPVKTVSDNITPIASVEKTTTDIIKDKLESLSGFIGTPVKLGAQQDKKECDIFNKDAKTILTTEPLKQTKPDIEKKFDDIKLSKSKECQIGDKTESEIMPKIQSVRLTKPEVDSICQPIKILETPKLVQPEQNITKIIGQNRTLCENEIFTPIDNIIKPILFKKLIDLKAEKKLQVENENKTYFETCEGNDLVNEECIERCKNQNLGEFKKSEIQNLLNDDFIYRCLCGIKFTTWITAGDKLKKLQEEKPEPKIAISGEGERVTEEPKNVTISEPEVEPEPAEPKIEDSLDQEEEPKISSHRDVEPECEGEYVGRTYHPEREDCQPRRVKHFGHRDHNNECEDRRPCESHGRRHRRYPHDECFDVVEPNTLFPDIKKVYRNKGFGFGSSIGDCFNGFVEDKFCHLGGRMDKLKRKNKHMIKKIQRKQLRKQEDSGDSAHDNSNINKGEKHFDKIQDNLLDIKDDFATKRANNLHQFKGIINKHFNDNKCDGKDEFKNAFKKDFKKKEKCSCFDVKKKDSNCDKDSFMTNQVHNMKDKNIEYLNKIRGMFSCSD